MYFPKVVALNQTGDRSTCSGKNSVVKFSTFLVALFSTVSTVSYCSLSFKAPFKSIFTASFTKFSSWLERGMRNFSTKEWMGKENELWIIIIKLLPLYKTQPMYKLQTLVHVYRVNLNLIIVLNLSFSSLYNYKAYPV